MTPRRLVTAELLRVYRPAALFMLTTMVLVVAVGMFVLSQAMDARFSLWLTIAASATKFWLGVVGVLLSALHLRPFLGAGLTRRDIMAGSATLGLLTALGFAILVPVGHGVEHHLLSVGGHLSPQYPDFSPAVALREFGYVLAASLGFLVTGTAAGACFYRFAPWQGFLLLVPAAVPAVAAEAFFGIDGHGGFGPRLLPYLPAVVILLAVTVLGALFCRRLLADIPVRPSVS